MRESLCMQYLINYLYFDELCSGDQDSVVPLLGSRTLIRELAHDLKFKMTVPYGAWFHKGQVFS